MPPEPVLQRLADGLRAQLSATLADHGISNPGQTLENIQTIALQLEKTSPELSNMARANLAILNAAQSRFVAKVNIWFDQTMDRVSHRFTVSTRAVTFVCGLLLAIAFQIDAVSIVNRISVDDALRDSLATQARESVKKTPDDRDLYRSVIDQGVVSIPHYPDDLKRFGDIQHWLGIIFTTLLLSLGAPFWYGALSQLVQFRSKITQVDDLQRKQRQSTQDSELTPAGPAAVSPGILSGERGDLTAVG